MNKTVATILLAGLSLLAGCKKSAAPTPPPHALTITHASVNEAFALGANWSGNISTWTSLIPINRVRLYDSCTPSNCTYWSSLNPSNGSYNWGPLDTWLGGLRSANIHEFIYTFARTPSWATSGTGGSCTQWGGVGCKIPASTSYVTSFMVAIHNHVNSVYGTWFTSRDWECWNEPNGGYWAGWPTTASNLVSTCAAMYHAIKNFGDSRDTVSSPPQQGCTSYKALDAYLNAGGGSYADIIGFHYYCSVDNANGLATPENSTNVNTAVQTRVIMSNHGLSAKKLWNTEYSFTQSKLCNQDQQAAWVIRKTVIALWKGVNLNSFYQVDQNGQLSTSTARLWVPSSGQICGLPVGIQRSGKAWNALRDFMAGGNAPSCTVSGSVWKCSVNGAFTGQIAWTTSGTSSETSPVTGHKIDYQGNSTSISFGNAVSLSTMPVMLTTR